MKLAVIGTGFITREALEAVAAVPGITVTALYARPRSRARGEELAAEFGIPAVFTDYQALLEQADADSVYIALVNSAHYEAARAALLAGKHVFLEKPFTITADEARALCQLAEEKGLVLLEAITSRHTPVYRKLAETLPELGRIHMVQANFAQYSSRYGRYLRGDVPPVFDPALYGGALRDLNIYNLSVLVGLFGPPEDAVYSANRGYNGVDTSGIATLRYADFLALCAAAKDSHGRSYFLIQGERGWLEVQGTPNAMASLHMVLDGQEADFTPEPEVNRMVWEFREFLRVVTERDFDAMRAELARTVDVVETVERLARD